MGSVGHSTSSRSYADFGELGINTVSKGNDFFSENSNYDEWMNGKTMTDEEYDAIKDYTGGDFRRINDALRGTGNLDPFQRTQYGEMGELASSGLDKSVLDRGITVYRGASARLFGLQYADYDSIKAFEGALIRDMGLISATPYKRSAWVDFVGSEPAFSNEKVLLTIRVPAGKGRGAWVNPFSKHGGDYGEKEFLVNSASVMRVSEVKQSKFGGIEVVVDWLKRDKSDKWAD